jgi:hypothetical protein
MTSASFVEKSCACVMSDGGRNEKVGFDRQSSLLKGTIS